MQPVDDTRRERDIRTVFHIDESAVFLDIGGLAAVVYIATAVDVDRDGVCTTALGNGAGAVTVDGRSVYRAALIDVKVAEVVDLSIVDCAALGDIDLAVSFDCGDVRSSAIIDIQGTDAVDRGAVCRAV